MAASATTTPTSTGTQLSPVGNGSPLQIKRRRQNRDRIHSLSSSPLRGGQKSVARSQLGPRRVVSTGSTDELSIPSDVDAREVNATTSTPPRTQRRSSEPPQQLLTPPPLTRKANSAPALPTASNTSRKSHKPRPEKWTPPKVDDAVAALIREPLKKSEMKKKNVGFNYVMDTVLEEPAVELVKVGMTRGPVPKRRKEIEAKCHRETTWEPRNSSAPIRYYARAEKLIKAELLMSRYDLCCQGPCNTQHTEYHTAPRNLVLDVTDRWIYFCETKPWDETGNLHPFWQQRLRNLQASSRDRKTAQGMSRPIEWKEFTHIGRCDVYWFNICQFFGQIKHRWLKWFLFMLGLVIAGLSYPNPWGFRIFVFVILVIMLQFTLEGVKFMGSPTQNHPKPTAVDVNRPPTIPGAFDEPSSSTEGGADNDDEMEEEDEDEDSRQGDESVVDEMELDHTIVEENSETREGTEELPITISSSEDEDGDVSFTG